MKTCLFSFLTCCLLLITADAAAQSLTVVDHRFQPFSYRYPFSNGIFTSNVPLNEISPRAFRHFLKTFPQINDEKWTMTSQGIVASFVYNSAFHRICYSKNGSFLFSFTYYEGKDCPAEIKKIAAVYYPGFAIKNAVTLFDGTKEVYGLTIFNHQINRLLEYHDGELKMMEEYNEQQ